MGIKEDISQTLPHNDQSCIQLKSGMRDCHARGSSWLFAISSGCNCCSSGYNILSTVLLIYT